MRIGLISDTHGLVRPEASAFLEGSDLIIHAGDICDASVLEALRTIAPTVAVRGNNDRGSWAAELRHSEMLDAGGIWIYVVHDIADLEIDPEGAGVAVVVSGHSHKPAVEWREDVLFVNPGSAGPRRFKLPISAGELIIDKGKVSARIADLIQPSS